jgi:hypothetical protein
MLMALSATARESSGFSYRLNAELTGAFRGSNLVVWLTAPSQVQTNGPPVSTLVYALPKYVSMARTDLEHCE